MVNSETTKPSLSTTPTMKQINHKLLETSEKPTSNTNSGQEHDKYNLEGSFFVELLYNSGGDEEKTNLELSTTEPIPSMRAFQDAGSRKYSTFKTKGLFTSTAETASSSYEAISASTITTTFGNGTIASTYLTWDTISVDDHELRFLYLAHKKCSTSALLNEEEKMYLSNYKSSGSPKADLLFICTPLLLKEELTCEEDALLELSLSGIYNYLNLYMKKVYKEKLNISPPSTIITTTAGTNSVDEAMADVRNLLDSEKDMEDMLYKVQLGKARLVKEKFRHSDMYKTLAILEKVIEDTQLWNEAGDEQEMAFYQRFASYLDILLVKTNLNMIDGETGCFSSKIAIKTNKQLLQVEDYSAAYAHKIDLLLRYNDRYELISLIVDKMIKHNSIFTLSKSTPSEADVMIKIWADFFEVFFYNTEIYIRWREKGLDTSNDDCTIFKLDAKLVLLYDGTEYPISSVDFAPYAGPKRLDRWKQNAIRSKNNL
ncbi:hypothetical protein G6F56_001023 [Rhizopus delemar]|nr:hypothetical protein G6F56_001023 [Rhizopus delemar]